jgi:CheY-like chemotaxis protein
MMAVDDQRGGNSVNEKKFPVGMRILAVDDDPICLKVLENLLRKCQYEGMFQPVIFSSLSFFLCESWNMIYQFFFVASLVNSFDF